MSIVHNEPKNLDPELQDYRGQLEHRALWLLLLCREAEKHGLKWEDFACDAIAENGQDYRFEESEHPVAALRTRKKDNTQLARSV